MSVEVRYRGRLAALVGTQAERMEAGSVAEVLARLKKTCPREVSREARRMLIVVNGVSIQLKQGYRTPLREGDVLTFLPICGGG